VSWLQKALQTLIKYEPNNIGLWAIFTNDLRKLLRSFFWHRGITATAIGTFEAFKAKSPNSCCYNAVCTKNDHSNFA
jgi:hypothetical protein